MGPMAVLSTIILTFALFDLTLSQYYYIEGYLINPYQLNHGTRNNDHHRHHKNTKYKSRTSTAQSRAAATATTNKNGPILNLGGVVKNLSSSLNNVVHHDGDGKVYKLTSESAGKTFFNDWDFFSEADPTHGMVDYQTVDEAWKEQLVSVGPSSLDKNTISAVMKVDDKSWLGNGQHRKSVRLSSKKSFKYGLLVLDAIKIPFGCSTWPAFWTVGDNWPVGGEIDIVEGVNMLTTNQMTLHTDSGCNLKNPMSSKALGKVLATNCAAYASGNAGCGVTDVSEASYGQPFNQNGGGVFVMEWAKTGISIWRFNRGEIPSDLARGDSPQPSSWPHKPMAHWSNDDCNNLSDQFSEHRVIFDITLCGDWAGAEGVYSQNSTCGGTCSKAVMDPNNFHDAVWEVASVRLYQ